MRLPNPCKLLPLLLFLALWVCGCGGQTSNTNTSLQSTSTSRFPFPTKEPEIYQGDFVIGDGQTEQQYFVARSGESWRFDIKRDGGPWITQLSDGDKVYFVDHAKKIYSTLSNVMREDFDTAYFNSLSWGFFRGANYIEYDEVGRAGGLVTYKARTLKNSKSDVTITIDEKSGVMIRQEIADKPAANIPPVTYVYEVRNLKLEADDSLFDVPSGYSRVNTIDYVPRRTKRPGEE